MKNVTDCHEKWFRRFNTLALPALVLGGLLASPGHAQEINPDTAFDEPAKAALTSSDTVLDANHKTVTPRARPAPGTYTGQVEVLPYHPAAEARIFYTVDGSEPTLESAAYLPRNRGSLEFYSPIRLTKSQTLKLKAVVGNALPSDVASFEYTISVAPPQTIFGSGEYLSLPESVVLQSATPGAVIHYTLDGSEPTHDSPRYSEPLDLSGLSSPVRLSAIAIKEGELDSPISRFEYELNPNLTVLAGEETIPDVIAAMTAAEKALLLTGRFSSLRAAGATNAIPRLHITSLELADGPAGVRLGGRRATAFPNPMLLASTWNQDLVQEVGRAIGNETRHYGADVILGPGMNIHRDPLGGRVFEYFSEDPYLTGVLAGAWVSGAQALGVAACLKHYVANQYENNRRALNVVVSERALREIYLRSFELAIEASDPRTIMASYNLVNGIHATESRYLLKELLRDEFGFSGLVMPDWGAYHHARSAYSNGLDLNTPGGNLFGGMFGGPDITIDEILGGDISDKDIDRALTNILRVVVQSNSFQEQIFDRTAFVALSDLSEDLKLAGSDLSRRVASEGIVLLRNANNTLPLPTGLTGAVAGATATDVFREPENIWGSPSKGIYFQGGGSARVNVDPEEVVSLLQGLSNSGFGIYRTDALVEGMDAEEARVAAQAADVGIVLVGRPGQENTDNTSLNLTAEEIKMITDMASAFHDQGKPVIVLLNVAHPVVTLPWEDTVDAILYIGMPGNYGANVVADILTGRLNPSGKLTDTWPRYHADVPFFGKAPSSLSLEMTYDEGVFIGYRHFDRHPEAVRYPFGFGLSYTQFEYADLKILPSAEAVSNEGVLRISVDITNTGTQAGKEIAQLYIVAPPSKVERPIKELKGFAKTGLLLPGETETLTFELDTEDFYFFDEAAHDWALQAGMHTILIGPSGGDDELRSRGINASVNLPRR